MLADLGADVIKVEPPGGSLARRLGPFVGDEPHPAWSRRQDAHAAERALQARGVPASAVQNSRDLLADPQLAARGHFVRLTHPTRGSTMVEGSRFRLSRTPAQMPTAAPTLGRDTAD